MNYILDNKKYFIIGFIILLLLFLSYCFLYQDENDVVLESLSQEEITTVIKNNKYYVDVKGAVKKPGVYEFKDGDKVIDAINTAGGLTKSAVTSNINLSQKLKNEMVVYVFKSSELKQNKTTTTTSIISDVKCDCETIEVNNCIKEDTTNQVVNEDYLKDEDNNKININTSSESELTTIIGIGESKAKAIISYRNEHGKFESIKDIKNVSGIGDSLFDKIKDYITV